MSDELCKEHNLSIISSTGQRGKKYNEWQADKRGSSAKTQLRKDINIAIKSSSTYDEFLLLMRAKGYEIKGENFGDDVRKYISFRPLNQNNSVRGSARSLEKNIQKKELKIGLNKNGNAKLLFQRKIILPESWWILPAKNLKTVRN